MHTSFSSCQPRHHACCGLERLVTSSAARIMNVTFFRARKSFYSETASLSTDGAAMGGRQSSARHMGARQTCTTAGFPDTILLLHCK